MNNVEKLVTALSQPDVEIVIRRSSTGPVISVSNDLQTMILDRLKAGAQTGLQLREYVAKQRGVDSGPIANEVAWALVELQNSTRKRSSYIDKLGPIVKKGKLYMINGDL